ncbi:hypothetical protein CRYUN_Cryun02cG0065500 [Craigia yunnanensis]
MVDNHELQQQIYFSNSNRNMRNPEITFQSQHPQNLKQRDRVPARLRPSPSACYGFQFIYGPRPTGREVDYK